VRAREVEQLAGLQAVLAALAEHVPASSLGSKPRVLGSCFRRHWGATFKLGETTQIRLRPLQLRHEGGARDQDGTRRDRTLWDVGRGNGLAGSCDPGSDQEAIHGAAVGEFRHRHATHEGDSEIQRTDMIASALFSDALRTVEWPY